MECQVSHQKGLAFCVECSYISPRFTRRLKEMAKKGIHPDYHKIKVVMAGGKEFYTCSTYGKEGDTLQLSIDSETHPAYTGQQKMMDQAGRMEKFNQKYGRKKIS